MDRRRNLRGKCKSQRSQYHGGMQPMNCCLVSNLCRRPRGVRSKIISRSNSAKLPRMLTRRLCAGLLSDGIFLNITRMPHRSRSRFITPKCVTWRARWSTSLIKTASKSFLPTSFRRRSRAGPAKTAPLQASSMYVSITSNPSRSTNPLNSAICESIVCPCFCSSPETHAQGATLMDAGCSIIVRFV